MAARRTPRFDRRRPPASPRGVRGGGRRRRVGPRGARRGPRSRRRRRPRARSAGGFATIEEGLAGGSFEGETRSGRNEGHVDGACRSTVSVHRLRPAYCAREPCVMCAMALVHSRVRRVVFGGAQREAGRAGGVPPRCTGSGRSTTTTMCFPSAWTKRGCSARREGRRDEAGRTPGGGGDAPRGPSRLETPVQRSLLY